MMEAPKKVLESKTIIRFQDCDPYNHLNNAKYIDYFINAREDQLIANYGLNIYRIGKLEGIGWVVASNKIAYLNPANLMEVVLIESQVIAHDEKSLLVELRMWDHRKTILKAFMWSQFIHIDLKTGKSKKHADNYLELFRQVVEPVEERTFDERQVTLLKLRSVATG